MTIARCCSQTAPCLAIWKVLPASSFMNNKKNVSDVDRYAVVLQKLLSGMISEAASGGSGSLNFTRRISVAPDFSTKYVLAQCTPPIYQSKTALFV